MITYDAKSFRTWSVLGASGTFGTAVLELAEDPDFAVITSDLCFFSGLEKAKKTYEEKIINVGIAEQNMISIAGGMAKEGMHVWATTYASFISTRALDQVKVNMGYMNLPIHAVGLGAGLSTGILGATHMAIEDIAIMRSIPNLTIISPADCAEMMKAIMAVSKMDKPVYIRLPSLSRIPIVYDEDFEYEVGRANWIIKHSDSDIAIFATGITVRTACDVARKLEEQGVICDVIDMHTIKPLDMDSIFKAVDKKMVVTIEEHSIIGGLGSAIAEATASLDKYPPILRMGVNDFYPHAASYDELVKRCGLDSESIISAINREYSK